MGGNFNIVEVVAYRSGSNSLAIKIDGYVIYDKFCWK